MPTYVYACEDCKITYEVNASIKEKEEGLKPKCPQCGSHHSHQMITTSFSIRGGDCGNMTLGCNPGGGCCG